MEFTIHVPWLTPMRRLAIGLSILLALVAMALPASAAPPEGIEGEVTVVNGRDQPVPVTGDVTADVTGSVNVAGTVTVGNEATDPVPVSGDVTADVTGSVMVDGSVAATQSGDWTVGLDPLSATHLANIDAATDPLTYDSAGNLNVNVAAGGLAGSPQLTTESVSVGHLFGQTITSGDQLTLPVDLDVTSFAITSDGSLLLAFEYGTDGTSYHGRVIAGTTLAQTFPHPLRADRVRIICNHFDHCEVWGSVNGY